MSIYVKGYDNILPSTFREFKVSELHDLSFTFGELELDPNSPYFPGRSDLKVMREDVKASIVSLSGLFEELGIGDERSDFSLFVASGAFIESTDKHLRHIMRAFEMAGDSSDPDERMAKLYRASPPLLALQTLTNSVMSFIAQYLGVKGNNATLGNTSISGYYAISEAMKSVERTGTPSVVCTSNASGGYSYLMNAPQSQNQVGWKESAAVGNLVLAGESSDAICIIEDARCLPSLPQFGKREIQRNWKDLIPVDCQNIILSGGFTEEENNADLEYCRSICTSTTSLFDEYGNLGPANITASIAQGIKLLKDGAETVDIVDRDIYGKESWIRIRAI